ncbi:unnamed protein product [Trifolium pratense]|uniref:Uncharacterized protein n=1 Tax=Trifolium pratense TaxID=57577 RepID=A0ACB0IP45_TRIPR|nr:unnamed protein product [Trifolium pratense]
MKVVLLQYSLMPGSHSEILSQKMREAASLVLIRRLNSDDIEVRKYYLSLATTECLQWLMVAVYIVMKPRVGYSDGSCGDDFPKIMV